jgi:FtsP/CotA-like multicopper oxidase with cupredoxin domain
MQYGYCLPPMTSVADMVPDNPGTWLFHCHMPVHYEAGDLPPVFVPVIMTVPTG